MFVGGGVCWEEFEGDCGEGWEVGWDELCETAEIREFIGLNFTSERLSLYLKNWYQELIVHQSKNITQEFWLSAEESDRNV